MAKKRSRGRPRAAQRADGRYTINLLPDDKATVDAAAALDGERFPGRWVGRTVVAAARKRVGNVL